VSKDSKLDEWTRSWPLPLIAMLGITGPAAFSYSGGIFMGEMTRTFGWSKTQFSSAFTLQVLLGLIIGPLAAMLLDRIGPRRMLLAGIAPFALGLSLFGLVTGPMGQWWMLAALYSVCTAGVIPAAWMSGVVQSFDKARGMAMAVGLAGIGIATSVWPILVAWLVQHVGWRQAFPAMGIGWAVLLLPLTFFFYKPVKQAAPGAAAKDLPPIWPVVWTRTFWCLLGAGGIFAAVQMALIMHFVPILQLQGFTLTKAAGIAGIIGIFSIIGRVGTGTLLDWVPTKRIAIVAFTLPLLVMWILETAHGSAGILMLAAALLGFAAGSETDVVAYLCSRRFDQRIFGTIYTLFQTGFAILASLGPLLAGWRFDVTKGYESFYILALPMVLTATLLIMLVPAEIKAGPDNLNT